VCSEVEFLEGSSARAMKLASTLKEERLVREESSPNWVPTSGEGETLKRDLTRGRW